MIVKDGTVWLLKSKNGDKILGKHRSLEEARLHARAIHFRQYKQRIILEKSK